MTVMPANNTSWIVDYWQGRYGGLGHLYSPQRKENPRPHMLYALDNGAWPAFKNGQPWDAKLFIAHIERYAFHALRPDWVIVPDVVADMEATWRNWYHWTPHLHPYDLSYALAVQDGMTPSWVRKEIRPKPGVIFIGGSTDWKWSTLAEWCREFPRVHVGRVNTGDQLERCRAAGAESVDGTGWFRGQPKQIEALGMFLMRQAGFDEPEHVRHIVKYSRHLAKNQFVLPLEGVA